MIIVDTSVAVKWFLEEPSSDVAKKLVRGDDPLGAPELLRLELLNVLVCKKELSTSQIQFLFNLFDQVKIEFFVLSHRALIRTAELCRKYSITAYDATFIALAEALKANFVTADRKLLRKLKALPYVRPLF